MFLFYNMTRCYHLSGVTQFCCLIVIFFIHIHRIHFVTYAREDAGRGFVLYICTFLVVSLELFAQTGFPSSISITHIYFVLNCICCYCQSFC